VHNLCTSQFQFVEKVVFRISNQKFFGPAIFQKCWRNPKAEPLVAHRSERKSPVEGAFTRGELKNSPVGCFSRGDALQEKASPYYLHSQSKSADLIGTKLNIEVFLQAERCIIYAPLFYI